MLWKGLTVVRPSFQDFTNIHLRSAAAIQATTCQSYHHGRQHCCHHYASSSRRSRSTSWRSSLPPPYSVPHSLTVPCRQLSAVGLSYLAIIKYKCLICNHCWQFGCITSSSRWRRLTELKPGGKRWVGCRRKISKELEMLSLPCHSLLESHYEIAVQNYQCVKGHKSKAQRSQVSRIISWVIDANQQTCTPTI